MSRTIRKLGTKAGRNCKFCGHFIRRYWRVSEHERRCKTKKS